MKKIKLNIVVATTICFQLFATNTNGQITKILDFNDTVNGGLPIGSLVTDGEYLYGMSSIGGAYGYGNIFKIKPDGTAFEELFSFYGVYGSFPRGSLVISGNYLYGMTRIGGGGIGGGTIFRINKNGSAYSLLLSFKGTNGKFPYGSLITDGNFFYGMTSDFGTDFGYYPGVIFKIKPDGTDYSMIYDFDKFLDGAHPYGSLILEGGYLYGMTKNGGTNDSGLIFKIRTDGTSYSKLTNFDGINGKEPYGSLISIDNYLYGMTRGGGSNSAGVLFKIKNDGSGFTKLFEFSGDLNGGNPYGDLIYEQGYLYGMTNVGGMLGYGVIFRIKPDGTRFSKLIDFNGNSNGSYPQGSLISDGTFLYGMTYFGGNSGFGTIFKYEIATIGVDNFTFQNSQFDIYPNPANRAFTVSDGSNSLTSNSHYQVSVINVFGQTLEEKFFSGSISFETSTWAKGIYFVQLKDENGVRVRTKKVLVE